MEEGEAAMDRSIPHVRDIFAPYRGTQESTHDHRIHVYEHSPGSRRRRHDFKEDQPPQDFIDTDHSDSTDEGPTPINNNRDQVRVRDRSRHSNNNNANRNSYSDILNERNDVNNVGGRAGGGYSSKTLTERDIRHLERHLSMKKTIRKQISRNLAQAFVDDTIVLQGEPGEPVVVQHNPKHQQKTTPTDCSFTLTRAKMAARSEHTFLDMLKKDSGRGPGEADSGHSSPSHQGGFEDEPITAMELDYDPPAGQYLQSSRQYDQQPQPQQQQQLQQHGDQNKKQSFWKKLGFKGKAKR